MFLCFYVRQRTTSDYLRLTLHNTPLLPMGSLVTKNMCSMISRHLTRRRRELAGARLQIEVNYQQECRDFAEWRANCMP